MYLTQPEKHFRCDGEEELINGQTPWRASLAVVHEVTTERNEQGQHMLREAGELKVAERR